MIDELKPYAEYKESGVPWLGKVPEHWKVRRQRNVVQMLVSNVDKHTKEDEIPVRLCNYVDVYKNDRITDRLAFMRATASADEIERFRLQIGDVVITKDSEEWNDIGVPALVEYSAPDLVCGYHLAILRPRDGIALGGYLLRALQSKGVASQLYVAANGVTRYGLSKDAIKSVVLPVPPLPEQSAIVRYFDIQDRRINRLIRTKRRLIELLNEKKKVTIHRAVTRGLDPNVRLKSSGIDWLGEVPEHWDVKMLGFQAQMLVPMRDKPPKFNGDVPWIRIEDFNGKYISDSKSKQRVSAEVINSMNLKIYPIGTVLCSCSCNMGATAIVEKPLVSNQTFIGIVPKKNINSDFLYYLMNANSERLQYLGSGAIQQYLAKEDFQALKLGFPPILEQRAIASFLDSETAKLDALIAHNRDSIEKLREYRTRLISDVVTGKLDVRGAELPAMEEAEVLEDIETGEDTEAEELIESEEVADADE